MSDLQKFAVKVFAESASVKLEEFIPVFHRWIQTRAVEGILIDVADYSHVKGGPGVMLVGHEGDFSMDAAEGPLGLLYSRKQPMAGTLAERVEKAARLLLEAAARLEQEPELKGRLKFRSGEALFVANDRLLAPNTDGAFAEVKPPLEAAGRKLFPDGRVHRRVGDPRARLAARLS